MCQKRNAAIYLERSAVRQILIGQLDQHLHITESILPDVDSLPIFTKTNLGTLNSAPGFSEEVEAALPRAIADYNEVWNSRQELAPSSPETARLKSSGESQPEDRPTHERRRFHR